MYIYILINKMCCICIFIYGLLINLKKKFIQFIRLIRLIENLFYKCFDYIMLLKYVVILFVWEYKLWDIFIKDKLNNNISLYSKVLRIDEFIL